MILPTGKFPIIYADPAWQYADKNSNGERGAAHKYRVMSLTDMMLMPVNDLAAKNAVCLMWVTAPMMREGLALLAAWGFTYKTVAFNWTKLNSKPLNKLGLARAKARGQEVHEYGEALYTTFMGLGRHTRGNGEFVLLGVKGAGLKRERSDVRQEVIAPRREHSRKPDEVRGRIVQLYGDIKRVELFARQRHHGWVAWGDQV